MTALASYTDVVNEVQDWLFGRTDLAAKVDTFIRLAEAKANRLLDVRQMESRATTTVNLASAAPEYVSLPLDFQTMRRVRAMDVTGSPVLRYLTPVQLADKWEELGQNAGDPVWFTVIGSEMQLCPTPVNANTLEMLYRRAIPSLTAANPNNWLLTEAPDFYLYGSLLEAAPYLHEDERIPVWSAGVAAAIQQLNDQSEKALYNAGPLTMRRRGRAY